MKLERLPYEPSALLDFYESGFTAMGALCERTWHDRLEIVAEGRAATPWNPDGALHDIELTFASPDATAARDASREVFPGCPLTFRLAETLRPTPLPLERVVLAPEQESAPDALLAEKLWRAQFPDTTRWRLAVPLKAAFHFSLVVLVRAEIQAIAQHWSIHRLAVALPSGETDESLARTMSFAQVTPDGAVSALRAPAENAEATGATKLSWPAPDPERWRTFLRSALEEGLESELAGIRLRQEQYLRRELERIDDYFENYERELTARAKRSASSNVKEKTADRLAAARAEHTHRRTDQVARHEIRVQPHFDALLLVAEPAWRATVSFEQARAATTQEAVFVPRARRWFS